METVHEVDRHIRLKDGSYYHIPPEMTRQCSKCGKKQKLSYTYDYIDGEDCYWETVNWSTGPE